MSADPPLPWNYEKAFSGTIWSTPVETQGSVHHAAPSHDAGFMGAESLHYLRSSTGTPAGDAAAAAADWRCSTQTDGVTPWRK
jgi:hypothetical protein